MIRRTVRTRLTLLYGGLFTLVTTAVLITIQAVLQISVNRRVRDVLQLTTEPTGTPPSGQEKLHVVSAPGARQPQVIAERVGSSILGTQQLVTWVAIGLLTVLALGVSWWLAGRVLRPLHRITETARRLSLNTLHERIAHTGPQDELKDLADTFDDMLDRLERSAASQRRFIANASHELRTPLAIQRAAIEIGLANPTPEKVARMRTELLRATVQSEMLIDGLLTLAQSEPELDVTTPVDLHTAVTSAVRHHRTQGIDLVLDLQPLTTQGDEVLLTRLVANLVQNAMRHNRPGGRVTVVLSPATGLVVSNTGPRVEPDQVASLFEPFRRLTTDRTHKGDGAGLGLSIVAAIATAHHATLNARANPEGGLTVTVEFASVASPVKENVIHRLPV
ncbi:MAG TPA: ATP-binding protein [Streptosporangiaceae bacterium]|nr:ATP-binding protein [Streptosporangiaceae bacterium]